MRDDPRAIERTVCAAGTMRRAARSLTRLYDGHLIGAGLTTTQFSILRTIERRGGRLSLAELATDLVFERTSLFRALAPMRRAGLVSILTSVRPNTDRRAKDVALTARAHRCIARALPHWVAAQRTVLDRFGHTAWADLAAQVVHLTAIARAAHAE